MKSYPQLLILASLCLCLSIACNSDVVSEPELTLQTSIDARNGVVDNVTGSGHFTIYPDTDSSFLRTFSFQAKRFADGSVTGQWQRTRRDTGNASGDAKSHGTITCFEIDGNYAYFGTDATSGILGQGGFRVYDGGRGNAADSISLQYAGRNDEFADLYCSQNFQVPVLNYVERGGITIH